MRIKNNPVNRDNRGLFFSLETLALRLKSQKNQQKISNENQE